MILGRLMDAWRAVFNGGTGLSTPDVTRVQQFALGQAAIVILIVLGFHLDEQTQQVLLGLSAALGAALPISDAVVRRGRADNAAELRAQQEAAAQGAGAKAAALGITEAERDAMLTRLLALSDPSDA